MAKDFSVFLRALLAIYLLDHDLNICLVRLFEPRIIISREPRRNPAKVNPLPFLRKHILLIQSCFIFRLTGR